MSVEEAVARFFPAGQGYDRQQALRLIHWLDRCGYDITRKEPAAEAGHKGQPQR